MCSCRCTMQARKATVLNCSIVAPAASADLSMHVPLRLKAASYYDPNTLSSSVFVQEAALAYMH